MKKYKYNALRFIPQSINFSEIAEDSEFDPNIIADYQQELGDSQEFELLLACMLAPLEDKKKLILIFQILRDFGFQFDHNSCAKIIGIKFRSYTFMLNSLRKELSCFMNKEAVLKKLENA